MEHSATCWPSYYYIPYNFQVGILKRTLQCQSQRDLSGSSRWVPMFDRCGFCSPDNSEWQGSRPACGKCTAFRFEKKTIWGSNLTKVGVCSSEKGIRAGGRVKAPWVPIPSLPRGRKLSRNSFHWQLGTCWLLHNRILLYPKIRSEISWSRDRASGTKDSQEIPSYQHKSSPQVKAVILPVAFSPSCPHKKAFKRSLISLSSCGCPMGWPRPTGGRESPSPSSRASSRSTAESSNLGMLHASWRKSHTF